MKIAVVLLLLGLCIMSVAGSWYHRPHHGGFVGVVRGVSFGHLRGGSGYGRPGYGGYGYDDFDGHFGHGGHVHGFRGGFRGGFRHGGHGGQGYYKGYH